MILESIEEFARALAMDMYSVPVGITLDKDSYWKLVSELIQYQDKPSRQVDMNDLTVNTIYGPIRIWKGTSRPEDQ